MASLKDLRNRIASVKATQKITDEILKQAGVRKKSAKVFRLAK